ncbi:carboxylesterase family domain-containing protein [Ditylenchus destructor]|nr:carboxylesterase family domain-containing protein [Ditylenchus destructor]
MRGVQPKLEGVFAFWIICLHPILCSVYVNLQDGSPLFGSYVEGPNGKHISQFLGIPFAEPPVGKLRFRKPVPKSSWRDPFNATTHPNSCVQSLDTYFGDFDGAQMWNSNVPSSEDCLYLNLYVPGKVDSSRRMAVLIWIYGGGFWSGSATLDVYDGKILASEEDVIVVAMNYRVSVFGFLYLARKEAPGNMGLWDQLEAVKWVHKNIENFGGDPNRITLFGESAGAASVSMHMLSERSIPYFQRAIVQSGSATAPWAMENRQVALHRAVVLYHYMKCSNSTTTHPAAPPDRWDMDAVLDCLMNATAEKLRDSEWAPVAEFADFPWVPVVDGDFLAIYFIVYQLADVFPPAEFFEKNKNFINSREVWLRSISNLLPRHMLKSSLALQAIIHEYEPMDLPVPPHDYIDSLDKGKFCTNWGSKQKSGWHLHD